MLERLRQDARREAASPRGGPSRTSRRLSTTPGKPRSDAKSICAATDAVQGRDLVAVALQGHDVEPVILRPAEADRPCSDRLDGAATDRFADQALDVGFEDRVRLADLGVELEVAIVDGADLDLGRDPLVRFPRLAEPGHAQEHANLALAPASDAGCMSLATAGPGVWIRAPATRGQLRDQRRDRAPASVSDRGFGELRASSGSNGRSVRRGLHPRLGGVRGCSSDSRPGRRSAGRLRPCHGPCPCAGLRRRTGIVAGGGLGRRPPCRTPSVFDQLLDHTRQMASANQKIAT